VQARRDVGHAVLRLDQPDAARQQVNARARHLRPQVHVCGNGDAVEVAHAAHDGPVHVENVRVVNLVENQLRHRLPGLGGGLPARLAYQRDGGVGLWVEVKHQHPFALDEGQRLRELHQCGGLGNAAFKIDETDDVSHIGP